jgi:Cys-tRNA(Pro)/Cys-tRNA(Cys) deacylase
MSKKDKETKTNAMRIIEAGGIPYETRSYDASAGFVDGITAAHETGIEEARCFKTLVLVGHSKENYVCVIPVAKELDLKKAARHFGEKNLEMIHAKDITKTTGYIKGGCSPIGMKKLFRTAIDVTAKEYETIGVSGGRVGLQMELNPVKMAEIISADFEDLTK